MKKARLLVTACLLVGLSPLVADEPAGPRYLILDNEATLIGRHIERDAGVYRIVGDGDGSELTIPAHKVLRLCAGPADAHAFLLARANLRDPDEFVRLARWGMKYDQPDLARADLEEALRLNPRHADARRLLQCLTTPDTPPANSRPAPSPSTAKPVQEHSYKAETLQTYAQRIQPILLNSCGAGGCHGGKQDSGFDFLRPLGTGGYSQSMTRQNLLRTLSLLDADEPKSSRLLHKALAEGHGGAKKSPLPGRDSPAYKALENWVLNAAPPRPEPASANANLGPGRFASAETPAPSKPSVEPRAASRPSADPESPSPNPAPPRNTPRTPLDPFDPAPFNREFHPGRE